MDFLEFKLYFRKHSGRFDLVDSLGADTGIGAIVSSSQKYLDSLADITSLHGVVFVDITSGDTSVEIPQAKRVVSAKVKDSAGKTHNMVFYSPTDHGLIQRLGISALINNRYTGDATASRPRFYSVKSPRLVSDSSAGTGASNGYTTGNTGAIKLYFLPESDADYEIIVDGSFYSAALVLDTDSSYWCEVHPELLFSAAMRQLEVIHRNSSGVRDWESAIMTSIVAIDMDGVEQNSTNTTEMESIP